jgi:hypothetical protein
MTVIAALRRRFWRWKSGRSWWPARTSRCEISIATPWLGSKKISYNKCYYWNDSDLDYLRDALEDIFAEIDCAVPEIQKTKTYRKTIDNHDPPDENINAHGRGSHVRLRVSASRVLVG